MRLRVEPVYGWGWFNKKNESVDPPEPFRIECDAVVPGKPFRSALGRLEGTNYLLSGMWILLVQRHTPQDGQCSLYAFTEKPIVPKIPEPLSIEPAVTGYAVVNAPLMEFRATGPVRLFIGAAAMALAIAAWQWAAEERLMLLTWFDNQYFEPRWVPTAALSLLAVSAFSVCVGLVAWVIRGFRQPRPPRKRR